MYRYPAFPAFAHDLNEPASQYEVLHDWYATTNEWWERAHQPGQFVIIRHGADGEVFYSIGPWDAVYAQRRAFFVTDWAICPVGQNVIIAQSKGWK